MQHNFILPGRGEQALGKLISDHEGYIIDLKNEDGQHAILSAGGVQQCNVMIGWNDQTKSASLYHVNGAEYHNWGKPDLRLVGAKASYLCIGKSETCGLGFGIFVDEAEKRNGSHWRFKKHTVKVMPPKSSIHIYFFPAYERVLIQSEATHALLEVHKTDFKIIPDPEKLNQLDILIGLGTAITNYLDKHKEITASGSWLEKQKHGSEGKAVATKLKNLIDLKDISSSYDELMSEIEKIKSGAYRENSLRCYLIKGMAELLSEKEPTTGEMNSVTLVSLLKKIKTNVEPPVLVGVTSLKKNDL